MIRSLASLGSVALIVSFLVLPAWAAGPYIVTDLGMLPGFGNFDEGQAYAINAAGQVAGASRDNSPGLFDLHPFLWSPTTPGGTAGSLLDLATGNYASPRQSTARGINSYGQVAGESTYAAGSFLFTPTSPQGTAGTMIDLGDLPGGDFSSNAYDINSRGQVVGGSYSDAGLRAYLWSPATPNGTTGAMVELGVLPGFADYSYAYGINASGQAVGKSSSYSGRDSAFLWTPSTPHGDTGAMVDLGPLNVDYENTEAIKINAHGQVVGAARAAFPATPKAFLWTPDLPNGADGSMIDLGHLPGGDATSYVHGINSLGQAVGQSAVGLHPGQQYQDHHAFLWTPTTPNGTTGAMVDLNSLLDPTTGADWVIFAAHGINDRGQIAAMGIYDEDGPFGRAPVVRGVLLTLAVPEPSSFLLVALGLAIALSMSNCLSTRRRAT